MNRQNGDDSLRGSVVIVGAGITGLTCAHRLKGLAPNVSVAVLESSDRAGGKIRTSAISGVVVDEAADAFLARIPAAIELCKELGLEADLVAPGERRAFVYRHGGLHRFPETAVLGVPTDLDAPGLSDLISEAGMRRAAQDLVMPRDVPGAPPPGVDESVGSFIRRRLGDEVMDSLVGPLLSGVNAGNADELSLELGAPQFVTATINQPSLIEGLREIRASALRGQADSNPPIFYGLRGGTQSLIEALGRHLPDGTVRTSSQARSVKPTQDGSLLVNHDPADAVVLAVPTFASAPLLSWIDPEVREEMASQRWSSVALVTLALSRSSIEHRLDGSGFVVSEADGLLMTACSFGSMKWEHWRDIDDADTVILRLSAGRMQDQRILEMDDTELIAGLLDDLAVTIGFHGSPLATRVSRWNNAFPQYSPGHSLRAKRWRETAQGAHRGLFLAGASYFGLGIPACISDAEETAAAVVEHLADLRHV